MCLNAIIDHVLSLRVLFQAMLSMAVFSGHDFFQIDLHYNVVTCVPHKWMPHYVNPCFRFCNENFKMK